MVIAEEALYWQRIWWLLSLDDVSSLADALWLPVDGPALAARLREPLERWIADPSGYLENPFGASYDLFCRVETSVSRQDLPLLLAWGGHVAEGLRHSRIGEWGWNQALTYIRNGRADPGHPWVVDFCQRLRAVEVAIEQRVDPAVRAQFDRAPTDWDQRAHKLQNVERESANNDVTSIVSRNVFAYAWHSVAGTLSRSELQQLYEVTQPIAAAHLLDRQGWPFPGSWRFFQLPFLERARATWG